MYFYVFDNNKLNYYNFLDSNFIPSIYSNISNEYVMHYGNEVYKISYNDQSFIPTLYNLSLANSPVEVDDTPVLTSFYSTIIDKIGWFGEKIINNYVYLSIIGVFIIIFIIEFIRRYLI